MSGSWWQDRRSSAPGSHRRRISTDWRWRCLRWLWRARQDSNLRPSAPEADALSTELQARGSSSEERRVGKSVDLGGRRIIKKKKKKKKKIKTKIKKIEKKRIEKRSKKQ